VLTLGGTNNPSVDGKLIGIFGTGGGDGTVSWQCGTAALFFGIEDGSN
jgi:type IV pilus assembly protein PilA